MEYAIELNQVDKRYKKVVALDNLTMQVPSGKVYGFLGRNGAGKTTTIRIITGLIKANAGCVKVMGEDAKDNRSAVSANIGAIVESPAFYRNLTGLQNLKITADLYGIAEDRIEEVLKIVDMSEYAKRKVKTYSTGMRQRLGIANALIHSPKILILDEPTNGLDPNGVKDLRRLIKNLSHDLGITILVSSHVLSEIEQIADHVGILNNGKLVDQFSMQDLDLEEQSYLLLEVDQKSRAESLLQSNNISFDSDKEQIRVYCAKEQNPDINTLMSINHIVVSNMNSVKNSLEDRFFSAVGANDQEVKGA